MNQRRLERAKQHAHVARLPKKLTEIPPDEIPEGERGPIRCWHSRDYFAALYEIENDNYPGLLRLTVNRVRMNSAGDWEDGLSWDELQSIKRACGFGDWYGVEVYPRDLDIVNVANMRHIWLLELPLSIGWSLLPMVGVS